MIFEPFYQGSHQRKGAVKGSGLGLSIARDCIRQMQGELSLVDAPAGQMSVFALRFPSRSAGIIQRIYPSGYFMSQFGLAPCLESSRATCTLRFLRAVHVRTACNITPTGIGLSLTLCDGCSAGLLPRRLWLVALPSGISGLRAESGRFCREKIRFNCADYLHCGASGAMPGSTKIPSTGCGVLTVPIASLRRRRGRRRNAISTTAGRTRSVAASCSLMPKLLPTSVATWWRVSIP